MKGEAKGMEKCGGVGTIKGLSLPQVPEWGARTWVVVVGSLSQYPREGRG